MADEKAVTTTNNGSMSETVERISSKAVAQQMVLKYASNLLSKERSQQFFAQVALMYRNNAQLSNCDPQSIFSSMMACVHLDLMPNTPEGYAYIIPYGKEAQFQLGYKGLVELAYRSGVVKSVNAELVFLEDNFSVELGSERKLTHNPSFDVEDRGNYDDAIAVYATAVLNTGAIAFEVMTKKQIEKIRKTSKSGNNGPWGSWADQMAKKTVLKRLLKLLPSSTTDNRFKVALELDSRGEAGKPIGVDTKTGEFIDGEIVPDVKASPDKKAAILAVHGVTPKTDDTDTNVATTPELPPAKETVHEVTTTADESNSSDAGENNATPLSPYEVPAFEKGKTTLPRPEMRTLIKRWLADYGLTEEDEIQEFMESIINKKSPGTFDEAMTILRTLSEELKAKHGDNSTSATAGQ